jgi:hypothetical protein
MEDAAVVNRDDLGATLLKFPGEAASVHAVNAHEE